MYKTYVTILLMCFINSISAQEGKKNFLKINTIPIFSGIYEFQYERVLNEKSSIQFGFGIGGETINSVDEFQDLHLETFGYNLNNPRNTEYSENTFTINFDYKYYINGNTTEEGLYLSPSIQYINYRERFSAGEQEREANREGEFDFNDRTVENELKLFNLRALIGYQVLIINTISLNPYFGPSFSFGDVKEFSDEENESEIGFNLNVGVYLGINF